MEVGDVGQEETVGRARIRPQDPLAFFVGISTWTQRLFRTGEIYTLEFNHFGSVVLCISFTGFF